MVVLLQGELWYRAVHRTSSLRAIGVAWVLRGRTRRRRVTGVRGRLQDKDENGEKPKAGTVLTGWLGLPWS